MQRLKIILLVFICSFTLTGCSLLNGTPFETLGNRVDGLIANPFNDFTKEHPENNLKDFLSCLQAKNYTGATKYVSEQVTQALNPEFLQQMAVGEGFNVTKVKVVTNGDKQPDNNKVIIYYKYDKEPQGSLGQEAFMVKEAGTWKVLSFGEFEDY